MHSLVVVPVVPALLRIGDIRRNKGHSRLEFRARKLLMAASNLSSIERKGKTNDEKETNKPQTLQLE